MTKSASKFHLLIALMLINIVSINATTRNYSYIVHASYPHSTTSYTQGLEFADGQLYESTGLYGQSRLLRVDLKSGEVEQQLATLPKSQFGEGITIIGDTIYMLTWREGTLHLFDRTSGKRIDTKHYGGEGWGLTSDGDKIFMSNGSNRITVRDKESFKIISSHSITYNGEPLPYLNELEWIDGRIWANIYTTDSIAIIDPESWIVEGMIELTGLLPEKMRTPQTDVLNGIAYNRDEEKIYVTGKNWPAIFEIEIIEK